MTFNSLVFLEDFAAATAFAAGLGLCGLLGDCEGGGFGLGVELRRLQDGNFNDLWFLLD